MSTLVIELPDNVAARLAAASERSQVSPSQIITDALTKALPDEKAAVARDKTLFDILSEGGALGCLDSGVSDLATNPKHMEGYGQWRRKS